MAGVFQAHSDPVANHAIVSKDGVPADDNSSKMVDSEPTSQHCLAGKFDSCKDLRDGFEDLIQKGKRHPQPPPPNRITPAAKAVYHHDPQSLTGKLAAVSAPVLADILKHSAPQWATLASALVSLSKSLDRVGDKRWSNRTESTLDCTPFRFFGSRTMLEEC